MKKARWWLVLVACAAFSVWGGYTRLDSLTLTGEQWVFTGYTPSYADHFEYRVRFLVKNSYQCLYCARNSGNNGTYTCFYYSDATTLRFDRANGLNITQGGIVLDKDYTIVSDPATRTYYVNGVEVASKMPAFSYDVGSPLTLFGAHSEGTGLSESTPFSKIVFPARFRFYGFRIYDVDGILKHDYVPACDDTQAADATTRYGVYDRVDQTFHPNLGTKACTPGKPVPMEDWLRKISVVDTTRTSHATEVQLAFDNPGAPQRLFLVSGTSDGGADGTNGWERVQQLADVRAFEQRRTVTVPVGVATYRFVLQPNIPGGMMTAYTRSTGNSKSYLDTRFCPDSNSSAYSRFTVTQKSSGQFAMPFGARHNGNNNQFQIISDNVLNMWQCRYGTQCAYSTAGKPAVLGSHEVFMVKNVYYLDGYANTISAQTFSKQGALHVFCSYDSYKQTYDNATMPLDMEDLALWDGYVQTRRYVPYVTDEGVAGLYDTIEGEGITNALLVAGPVLWSVTPSQGSIARATWTGGGDLTNLDDSANWACSDANGNAIPNGIPSPMTKVILQGAAATTFNCPAGSTFTCASVTVEDAAITSDCDWSGVSPIIAGMVTITGATLSLDNFSGTGSITSDTAGVLRIVVPADAIRTNSTVAFTGDLSLVKDGEGTWVAARVGQTYTGGTEVRAGTAAVAQGSETVRTYAATNLIYGVLGSSITVASNAVFDIRGNYNWSRYSLVLAGGTLTSTGSKQEHFEDESLGNITLTAPSQLQLSATTIFNSGVCNLNGHTLIAKG